MENTNRREQGPAIGLFAHGDGASGSSFDESSVRNFLQFNNYQHSVKQGKC
jgi:hypothetical protein